MISNSPPLGPWDIVSMILLIILLLYVGAGIQSTYRGCAFIFLLVVVGFVGYKMCERDFALKANVRIPTFTKDGPTTVIDYGGYKYTYKFDGVVYFKKK